MNRDYNFVPDSEDDELDDEFMFSPPEDDDECPYGNMLMALAFQDKPFGILWSKDKVFEFLKARGYKLLDRKNKETGEEYTIAVKSGSPNIPDSGYGNTKETFNNEIQDIIMKWILRIAKENEENEHTKS